MPQLANITVKKADTTTDITWSGIRASSGDKTTAVWRSNTVGSANSHRPVFTVSSRNNGNRTLRRVDMNASYPETIVGGDSVTRVVNQLTFVGSFGVPEGMADATKAEAVHQIANMVASALFKSQVIDGEAAS